MKIMMSIAFGFAALSEISAAAKSAPNPVPARTQHSLKRRVLILNFVNQANDKNSAYLSVSVAEAFIGPLQKTGQFELLNRDLAQKASDKLKLTGGQISVETDAIEIGKVAGAEVIVMGSFVTIGPKVRLQAKAVDVLASRISVSVSQNSKLSSEIFDKIDALAGEMSAKMAQALPPLAERTLVAQVRLDEKLKEKETPKKTQEPQEVQVTRTDTKSSVTYGGILWRSAVLPGWGHLYAFNFRGYIYMPLYICAVGTFAWSHFNFLSKDSAYQDAALGDSLLESKYQSANDASKLRGYLSFAAIAAYLIPLVDAAIFGGGLSHSGFQLFSFRPRHSLTGMQDNGFTIAEWRFAYEKNF